MATQVRFRRGTTNENDNFQGAAAEATIDEERKEWRIHDNETVGGHPLPGLNSQLTNLYRYAVSGAGVADYVIDLERAPAALVTGLEIMFRAHANNTGPSDLDLNELGAKALMKVDAEGGLVALDADDLVLDRIYRALYDADANAAAGAWIVGGAAGGGSGNGALFKRVVVFEEDGTWNKPETLVYAEVWAVGGGGAGGQAGGTGNGAGGGGGGGAAYKVIQDADLGSSEAVTVSAANGSGAGQSSSFGAHCSATGGGAGVASTSAQPGGQPGVGSGGNINLSGQGGGGGSDDDFVVQPLNGAGGSAPGPFGGGGGNGFPGTGTGAAAGNYGGGGGGGTSAAGVGAAGVVVVIEYLTALPA